MNSKYCIPLYLLLSAAPACAVAGTADTRPIAVDPVCKFYGDLGCVRVRVDDSTPRAVYKGKTYYFCCNDCVAAFHKTPEKFLENEK